MIDFQNPGKSAWTMNPTGTAHGRGSSNGKARLAHGCPASTGMAVHSLALCCVAQFLIASLCPQVFTFQDWNEHRSAAWRHRMEPIIL